MRAPVLALLTQHRAKHEDRGHLRHGLLAQYIVASSQQDEAVPSPNSVFGKAEVSRQPGYHEYTRKHNQGGNEPRKSREETTLGFMLGQGVFARFFRHVLEIALPHARRGGNDPGKPPSTQAIGFPISRVQARNAKVFRH